MIDSINFFIYECWQYVVYQFEFRDLQQWLLFFFPFVIILEAPRYLTPIIVLPILRLFGQIGDDKYRQDEFIRKNPKVSIIVAGRNESEIISRTIESLLELPYENKEIIVVDDASDDNMYEICQRYEEKGLIKLYQNESASGRSGRPVASNLGFAMSTGEFIISVDADTSFDRNTIPRMIGPFYDNEVGGVAGNLKARNQGASVWADFQAVEYMISISLWKRWTSLIGSSTQASGAFGAFRRKALTSFKGWDPELAEDADLSIKVIKNGWTIVFSPYAVAMTTVPEKLKVLIGQRVRWDKGTVRTYFHKHKNIFKFWRFGFSYFFELGQEYFLFYVSTLLYPFYLIYMALVNMKFLVFVVIFTYLLYALTCFFTILVAVSFSERKMNGGCCGTHLFFPFIRDFLDGFV